ncbi:unnamed protein product, partial [Ectocarpus sp. 8 AP-2014]
HKQDTPVSETPSAAACVPQERRAQQQTGERGQQQRAQEGQQPRQQQHVQNVDHEARVSAGATGASGEDGEGTRRRSACDSCSLKKIKCDGLKPCQACRKRSVTCHFSVKRPTGPR